MPIIKNSFPAFGLILGFALALTHASAAPTDEQISAVMEATVKNVIRPAYADFEVQAGNLHDSINQLCTSPGPAPLTAAQNQFTNVAMAWAGIELFRSGPVMEDNRLERILFYPDRKSTGLKQVQIILAKQHAQSISPDGFGQKSVAVQGLGALEFILFGTGYENLSNSKDAFRCNFAMTISGNIALIADELSRSWNASEVYSEQWTKAGNEYSVFINNREAINELLGTIVHGLEAIRDIRLGTFLRNGPNRDRPKSALFWRSENTLPVLKANLNFIQSLLRDGGLYSLANKDSGIVDAIEFELQQNRSAIIAIDKPLFYALNDEELRGKLLYFGTSLKFTIGRIDGDFAKDLSLSSGFSFSDGD